MVVAGVSGFYTIANGSREFQLVPYTSNSMPGFSALSRALGGHYGPRHLSCAFWVGDGIAESPRGTIHAEASPFPGLAFYCIVEVTPSGTAKALFKS